MRKTFVSAFLFCLPACLFAQYNMGIANGKYAGIQGVQLNPASIANPTFKWDLNIFSVGVNWDNNFVYIPKGDVPAFGFHSIIEGIIHNDKFQTHYDPGNPNKFYNFTLTNEILGPSFQLALPNNQAIGFSLAVRGAASIRNIPGTTAQNAFAYLKEPDLWNTTFSDQTTHLQGMEWLEYGFHYGTVIKDDGNGQWRVGVSLKYLQGIAAAYIKNTNIQYNIGDTTHLLFNNFNVDYGRTDYDTYRHGINKDDLNHGHGWGLSAGTQYVTKDYTLGFSILDIGAIDFNRNAAAFHLQTTAADFVNWGKERLTTNAEVDRTLSSVFYGGDSTKSQTASKFKMGLPTTLSLQGDWKMVDKFFVNATIIKGLGHGKGQGGVQPDIYSITPRYESQWLDVSLPFSLLYYGQWRPRLGLAVRAGYLFFGGDAPFGLLGKSNMEGVDFYAGLRFFVFNKN